MNELEAIMQDLRHALTPSGILGRVDTVTCLELVDALEQRLPIVFRRANEVIRAEKEILSRASSRAEAVVRDAEKRAVRMTEETALVRRAKTQADRIEAEARQSAADTLSSVAEYLDNLTRRTKDYARTTKPTHRYAQESGR